MITLKTLLTALQRQGHGMGGWIPAGIRQILADAVGRSAMLVRLGNIGQGALLALGVVAFLNPVEQGVWYSVASLLSVASMAELGFAQVVVQIVAHDVGVGQTDRGLAAAYFRIALRFAGVAAATYGLLFWGGALVFGIAGTNGGIVITAGLVGALVLGLAPLNSFFEGLLQISAANHRRFVQVLAYVLVCMGSLAGGLGLWAVPAALAASFVAGGLMLWRDQGREITAMLGTPPAPVSWREVFWPLQSRYAVSWLGGVFFHAALAPMLLLRSGAVEAGRFGLTWSLFQACAGLAIVWVTSQSAVFAAQVGAGEGVIFHANYWRRFRWSLLSFAFMAIGCLALVLGTRYFAPALGGRFVTPTGVIVLALAAGANLLMQLLLVFARSFREEPFVREAWVSSLSIAALSYVLAPGLGAIGAALAQIAGQLIILPSVLRKVRSYDSRLQVDLVIPGSS